MSKWHNCCQRRANRSHDTVCYLWMLQSCIVGLSNGKVGHQI